MTGIEGGPGTVEKLATAAGGSPKTGATGMVGMDGRKEDDGPAIGAAEAGTDSGGNPIDSLNCEKRDGI